jgi:hypothetical protein
MFSNAMRSHASCAKTTWLNTSWTICACPSFRLSRLRLSSARVRTSERSFRKRFVSCIPSMKQKNSSLIVYLTSSFATFSSSVSILQLPDAVHGSRCSLFRRGAPLRASRFRLQYRHTSSTNSPRLRITILLIYCRIRDKINEGTTGGPGLYVLA